MDRAVAALPRTNGNAPRHYGTRAHTHGEVAAALEAVRQVRCIHPSAVLCVEVIALTALQAGETGGALGRDPRGSGTVDDPAVADEGRVRDLWAIEPGRARCA